jgi:hypothetical protein
MVVAHTKKGRDQKEKERKKNKRLFPYSLLTKKKKNPSPILTNTIANHTRKRSPQL